MVKGRDKSRTGVEDEASHLYKSQKAHRVPDTGLSDGKERVQKKMLEEQ